MRAWLVIVWGLVAHVGSTALVEAACNVIPFGVAKPNESDAYFHGSRARLLSPFVIPTEQVGIVRRTCDTGVDFPDATPEKVRTLIVVRPPAGDPRVLVLKQGSGDCSSDPFTVRCAAALGAATRATCVAVAAADYVVAPKTLTVAMPDPNPAATPVRTTGGRATVAVVDDTAPGAICAKLAERAPGRCDEVVKDTQTYPTLAACIDNIRKPAAADECPTDTPHPIFAEATLLPMPNDIYELCTDTSASGLCKASLAGEARYALDVEGNALVPIYWKKSLDVCDQKCRKLSIRAELEQPRYSDFRENDDFALRNRWLHSYTYQGGRNHPSFVLDTPSDPGNRAIRAFAGSADEDTSVLRFSTGFGRCAGTASDRCNSVADCTGAACEPRCRNTFAACSDVQPCPIGDGACGRNFEFKPAYASGRWRLDRAKNVICHDDPAQSCGSDANCECVSFVVTLGGCDCGDPKPEETTAPAPVDQTAQATAPLVEHLGVSAADVTAEAASDEVLAVIVPRAKVGPRAPEACRRGDAPSVVAVARRGDCAAGASCALACPDLGPGTLLPRLAVAGTQVRLLQGDDLPRAPRRWWERLWYWLVGAPKTPAATTGDRARLRLVDLKTTPARLTTVADVLVSEDPRYDPLAVSPSGGTSFRIQAGRCATADGRTLGIPSLCYPDQAGACPPWSRCTPADVVIATDLALDADADGVPDAIDPSAQTALRAR